MVLKNHGIITGEENNTTDWKHESQPGFQTDRQHGAIRYDRISGFLFYLD